MPADFREAVTATSCPHDASDLLILHALIGSAGRADAKNWKLSIRVCISKKDEMQFMGGYPPVREYLRVQSTLLEASGSLVGKRVSVWGPFDEKYFNGTVESWDPALGKHCVR